jgi:hypothetical protein
MEVWEMKNSGEWKLENAAHAVERITRLTHLPVK